MLLHSTKLMKSKAHNFTFGHHLTNNHDKQEKGYAKMKKLR